MKNFLYFAWLILLIVGCTSYTQVFETKTTNTQLEDGFYVYETDTIKITYNFWANKGLFSFAIYNKLSKPIYVDWKKSAYIDNSVKLNYWVDAETTNAQTYYGNYLYNGPAKGVDFIVSESIATSSSTSVKMERITFIPPKSNYIRSQFYILPAEYFRLPFDTKFSLVPKNDDINEMTKVYEKSYSYEDSPLIFRNFIAFSDTEDFEQEYYADNEFYISNIKEMEDEHFGTYKLDPSNKIKKNYIKDERGIPIMFTNYKKNTSFYIDMINYNNIKKYN